MIPLGTIKTGDTDNKDAGRKQDRREWRYEKPSVTRIDLALEETMSNGCKMDSDAGCMGPPIAAYDAGS